MCQPIFRRDDGGDAPCRRFDFGRQSYHGQRATPAVSDHQNAPKATVASSCMVMEIEDTRLAKRRAFMADCGVVPEPTVEQLAEIALNTAQLAHHLLNIRPRVAMLSFSTKGSATHPSIGKMRAATALARQKAERLMFRADFDGELQVDAALVRK